MPRERLDRRLRTRFRVRIPFVLKSNRQEVRGATRNMSLLGISAYTTQSLSVVEPVQCLLELPQESRPVVANGTVIRCESLSEPGPEGSYEMGIFFKEFVGPGEATLAKFLYRVSHEEQKENQEGYQVLKKRIADRKRRKRLEQLRKRRRLLNRLRRRRQRLARQKRLKSQRRKKKASS